MRGSDFLSGRKVDQNPEDLKEGGRERTGEGGGSRRKLKGNQQSDGGGISLQIDGCFPWSARKPKERKTGGEDERNLNERKRVRVGVN